MTTNESNSPTRKPDPVNHPSHYTFGSIEVIDAIESWGLSFHLGNVVKYVARAEHKGTKLQDLNKAAWYLRRAIEGAPEHANGDMLDWALDVHAADCAELQRLREENERLRDVLDHIKLHRCYGKLSVFVSVPKRGFWSADICEDGEGIFLAWEETKSAALAATQTHGET